MFLDDWRFNELVIGYPLQLLWFEGASFVIARPQNQYSGHLRYTKDDPVFITTLEEDISTLSKNILPGDAAMMKKRLKIFRFHKTIVNPDRSIKACARCFSSFLLVGDRGALPNSSGPTLSGTGAPQISGSKRQLPQQAPSSRPTGNVSSWRVNDVIAFLRDLELGHLEAAVRNNGVDGDMLKTLSCPELVSDLGLSTLQAKKVLRRLPPQ